ncbi:MAG: pitrilysin family protein [Polyangiales bacterium]
MKRSTALPILALLASCSSTQRPAPQPQPQPEVTQAPQPEAPRPLHVEVPQPGPARDVHLPAIRRTALANGLEVNLVEYHTLPVLHARLLVRAGSASDPANLPGLASFTGDMLKEGTRRHTSAQFAEAIEFVGGNLSVSTGPDSTVISVSVLKDHADTAFSLLAELLTEPTFPQTEIVKLRRRELDRLERMRTDPGWLSRRAFYAGVYPEGHPYARVDTTAEALNRLTRNDLVNFHRARFVAGNMSLVVVGDVTPEALDPLLARTLNRVRRGTAPAPRFPAPATQTPSRRVVLVDRPHSAQSVVRIGNPSLRRASDDFVPLSVANQVLGGGAASRLFMDLRELRSLTYGAYARTSDTVDVGTWFSSASVRTPATMDALHALMRHLECLTTEPAPEAEMRQTLAYLVDSFPLSIETPGNVADLISGLRLYGLPDDWYDTYRTRVQSVDAAAAQQTAARYIRPAEGVLVVVGTADAEVSVGPACAAAAALPQDATFAQQITACATPAPDAPPRATMQLQEALRVFGPVRVVNHQTGAVERELTAVTSDSPALSPPIHARCEELAAPALQRVAHPAGEAPRTGH